MRIADEAIQIVPAHVVRVHEIGRRGAVHEHQGGTLMDDGVVVNGDAVRAVSADARCGGLKPGSWSGSTAPVGWGRFFRPWSMPMKRLRCSVILPTIRIVFSRNRPSTISSSSMSEALIASLACRRFGIPRGPVSPFRKRTAAKATARLQRRSLGLPADSFSTSRRIGPFIARR